MFGSLIVMRLPESFDVWASLAIIGSITEWNSITGYRPMWFVPQQQNESSE